jgi:hypothetical protein
MVARISEAIGLGLTEEETCALVGIEPNTLINWKKDPEFLGAIECRPTGILYFLSSNDPIYG